MSRVIVVGAGIGGLAVAARLARLRHEVTLIERAPDVGGHLLDGGSATIALPAALRDLFLKTGKPLETVAALEPTDLLARHHFPDGSVLDLPNTGLRDVAAALDATFGGRAGTDWTRFTAHEARVWDVVRAGYVEAAPRSPVMTRLAVRHPRHVVRALAGRSVRGVSRRHFTDPRLRLLVESCVSRHGLDPGRVPAPFAVLPYVEQTFRLWRVGGGVRVLVDALAARARERGVRICTGTAVTSTTSTSGRVDGVTLENGRRLDADIVVSDCAVGRPAVSADAISTTRLLLAVTGRTPGMARDTVIHDAAGALHVQVADDGGTGGDESWVVSIPTPPGPDVPARILERLATHGYDVSSRVVSIRSRERVVAARPGRAVDPRAAPGLFLVGDRVQPLGGVAMSTMSAAVAADLIGRA